MDKLGFSEYRETFFELLDSLTVTSSVHLSQEFDFYEEVVFKCFDLYQRENSNFSVGDSVKFFHIFLYAMFKHTPSVEKNDDEIKLY